MCIDILSGEGVGEVMDTDDNNIETWYACKQCGTRYTHNDRMLCKCGGVIVKYGKRIETLEYPIGIIEEVE